MANHKKQSDATIRDRIRKLLAKGSTGTLVTVLQSEVLQVGAKLLIRDGGDTFADLGDASVNKAAVQEAFRFLRGRDEAKSSRVSEFAPELASTVDALLLFERIEAEPRLVIGGAGHVGASLARLAAQVDSSLCIRSSRNGTPTLAGGVGQVVSDKSR